MRKLLPILMGWAFLSCTGGGGSSASSTPTPAGPAPTLASPAHLSSGLTGALLVQATAPTGTTAAQFQLDGEDLATVTSAPFQTALADTAAYASGQHVFRARVRDASNVWSAWGTSIVSFGGSVAKPAGFTLNSTWITGLSSATAFAFAPDGRLFVCQQGGALRVVKNGSLLSTPFLSLTVDSAGERGLLGIAFDPDFTNTRYLYVYYTVPAGIGVSAHNRISRYRADATTPDVVESGSESILADLPDLSSATNHNGGALHFGADGKLYAGVGENANSAHASDPNDPLGKLLRFNADGTIPSDNPYVGTNTGLGRAVWAYGLRNPFTFAVQPGTGRIHINDVGQSTWEEVNLGTAQANYGWPSTEGPTNATGITGPLFAYGHSSAPAGQPASTNTFLQGIAIAGGAFYPTGGPFGTRYEGAYFFGEYGAGWIARMDLPNGTDSTCISVFARTGANLVDLAVGPDGALYALGRSAITRISKP